MEDRASPEGNCVGPDFFEIVTMCVRVAQLDRALGYGPRCRGFESSHARSFRIAGSLYYQGFPAFFLSKNGCSTVFNGTLSMLIDIIFELSESVFRYRSMSRSSSDIRI